MAIVFAASVPHSSLFIPSIGKGHIDNLAGTINALREVGKECHDAKPDAVVFITCHAELPITGLVLNICSTYEVEYEKFGDFSTRFSVQGSPALGNALKKPFDTRRSELPLGVISEPRLDYSFTTPFFYLMEENENLPVVILNDTLATPG